MPRLSLAFFTAAVLCGLTGMIWGLIMGASNNFTTMPAHAHLNLLGWVTLALMGTFYAVAGERAPRRLGWINFVISTVGVIITIPFLAAFLSGQKSAEPVAIAGAVVVTIGMATFLASVVSVWMRSATAQA